MLKEFKYKQLSNEEYKVHKGSKQFLRIYEDHLTYSCWSHGELFDDETALWEDKQYSNNLFSLRSNVSSLQYYYGSVSTHWHVLISISGTTTDVCIDLEKEEDAKEMYEYLIGWKIK